MRKSKRITSAMLCALMTITLFAGCGTEKKTDSTESKKESVKTESTEKEDKKDLASYVKGLKDLTVEVNAKNVDFMNGVTFDKKVVKEVKADSSKVNLAKEGKYNLIYSIVPVDSKISKTTVTKTVTVKVVSVETAQKEADKGNQVVTSNNEIKKDSEGNTPAPAKEEVSSSSNSDNKSDNSSASNNSSSNSNNNSSSSNSNSSSNNSSANNSNNNASNNNSSNSNNSKPVEPSKPAEPEKPSEPVHVHNFSNYHAEEGYYETVVVTPEWDEPVYDDHTFCGTCGQEFTGANQIDEAINHLVDSAYEVGLENACQNYYTTPVQVGSTHHDAVTEQVYHKTADAYYTCSCGARQ